MVWNKSLNFSQKSNLKSCPRIQKEEQRMTGQRQPFDFGGKLSLNGYKHYPFGAKRFDLKE